MSRKHQNNHYHYAEKFDEKKRRLRFSDVLKAPRKAFTLALLVLLTFGLISTTFAAFTASESFAGEKASVLVDVHNTLAQREGKGLALTGANSDLAGTGWGTSDTWYIHSNVVTNGWGTGGDKCISNGNDRYYIFYVKYSELSSDSNQVRFRFYASGSNYNQEIGPSGSSQDATSGCTGKTPPGNNGDGYFYASLANNSLWQRVLVGANANDNYFWASVSNLDDMTAGLTVDGSSADKTINITQSVTLKGTCTNLSSYYENNGTGGRNAKYTYQYKKDSDSSWTDIDKIDVSGESATSDATGVTWTPDSAGTYKVRVIVNDTNILKNKNAQNDRYATSSEYTVTVRPKNTVTYSGYGDSLTSTSNESVFYNGHPASVPTTDANGYTFLYWKRTGDSSTQYTSAEVSAYTVTSDQTFTAYYNINAPTVTLTASELNYTVGQATACSLGGTVTSDASDAATSSSYAITNYPLGASSSNAGVTNDGVFTASVPGDYVVTLTGTASTTKSNAVNSSASATATCTIHVYPAAPSLTVTLTGAEDQSGEGIDGSTAEKAYKILLGGNYQFSAQVNGPVDNYEYSWSATGEDGTWNNFTSLGDPYQNAAITTDPSTASFTGNKISFAQVYAGAQSDVQCFTLYLRASRNGRSNTTQASVYYYVQRLIETFELKPHQKIYPFMDSDVSISATYNLNNAYSYTTTLFYSPSNGVNSFVPILREEGSNHDGKFIENFSTALNSYFYPVGVKYFKMEITNETVTSSSPGLIHTTVGTANRTAAKPFYFINNIADTDFKDYRVFAFWKDDSAEGFGYQTAQDIYKADNSNAGRKYRVHLPVGADKVIFAVARTDSYSLPTFNKQTDVFTFDSEYYYAYTDLMSFTEDQTTYTVNTKTPNQSVQGLYVLSNSDANQGLSSFVPLS